MRSTDCGLGIKYGLGARSIQPNSNQSDRENWSTSKGIKRGLQTGYKIEILGGGSLNQEPDKNVIFYTHFRHGLGL